MSQPARRLSLLAVVFIALGGFLGGVLGGRVQAEPQRADDQLWTFGRVLALVEDQYVGKEDTKEIVESAIDGLLTTLDPHSNYLSPESFDEMRDEQRGKFSGLGIQITKRGPHKPLTIIAPIDGTPAYRAGLQSGDMITEIEGESTTDMTVLEAVRLLKGDKGTEVTITIQRPGLDDRFDVTIERDDIPIESIRVAHMLTPDVGFVRIANFTSTTATELDQAIEMLRAAGMKRLVVDLRNNPGGLLEQAVQVSERFIPAGEMIVYTRGRIPGANQDYVAKRGVDRVKMPLVILVDGSSASASEIVSGAVQDHDRGLVVGETTFGKGLVQRVIPLQDGGALAVTTAKYYTPSGRLIQRDYSDLEEYYLTRGPGGEQLDEDSGTGEEEVDAESSGEAAEPKDDREVFLTDAGRKVYGGGGIRPDYIVESPRAPKLLLRMLRQNLIFDFAVNFVNSHADLTPDFQVDDQMRQDFVAFLKAREFEYTDDELKEHRDVVELRLRSQIARVKWDQVAESRVLTQADPQVQKALAVLEEAGRLSHRADEIRHDRELRAEMTEASR